MISINIVDNQISLTLPYDMREIAKTVPGYKWNKENKTWNYPATPIIASKIHFALSMRSDNQLQTSKSFDDLVEIGDNIASSQLVKKQDNLKQPEITQYPAWKHQLRAYHYAYNLPSCMLAMEMGTGKTKVCIDLILNKRYKKVLIVCPKSVGQVWENEIEKHGLGKPIYGNIIPLNGKKKIEKLKEYLGYTKRETEVRSDITITNYHSFLNKDFCKKIAEFGFDLIVLDESHNIKSPQGKISKNIAGLRNYIPNRICLTGTPMPHSPLDIFAQYRFLDPGIFGTSITRFRAMYAKEVAPKGQKYKMIVGWQDLDDLNKKMNQIAFQVDKSVLDLPDVIDQVKYCYLSDKEFKDYQNLEDKFFIELEQGNHDYGHAIVVINKLQQIAQGFFIHETGNQDSIENISSHKIDLLKETINEIGNNPIVIFYKYKHDMKMIHDMLNAEDIKYDTLENWDSWNKGETDAQVITIQIQSGGLGIDLTRANYCIYYNRDYSLGNYEQSKARVHRPGQKKTVHYVHLLTKGTVDEKIYNTLKERKDFIKQVLKERS